MAVVEPQLFKQLTKPSQPESLFDAAYTTPPPPRF